MRYAIERGIRCAIAIEKDARTQESLQHVSALPLDAAPSRNRILGRATRSAALTILARRYGLTARLTARTSPISTSWRER